MRQIHVCVLYVWCLRGSEQLPSPQPHLQLQAISAVSTAAIVRLKLVSRRHSRLPSYGRCLMCR